MVRCILIIIFLCYEVVAFAQYKLVNEVISKDTISTIVDVNTIAFEVIDNRLFQIRNCNESGGDCLLVTSYSLDSGQILTRDTIMGLSRNFQVRDIICNGKYVFFTDYDEFVHFEVGKVNTTNITAMPKWSGQVQNTAKFRSCEFINDSLVLLYITYRFHPFSSLPGLHLSIYNLNTKIIEKHKHFDFPGTGIAQIPRNWVTVVNQRIYALTPLSSILYVFDLNLDLIEKREIKVFPDTLKNVNKVYEKYIDSSLKAEINRLNNIANEFPVDFEMTHNKHYKSEIFSKEYLNKLFDTIKRFTYIERIFQIDNDKIGIVVHNGSDGSEYRSLCIYDVVKNINIRKYDNWRCIPKDSLYKKEDMFPVDITREKNFNPFFRKNKIYVGNFFPTSFFSPGAYADISQNIFKHVSKNGYVWTVLVYDLE